MPRLGVNIDHVATLRQARRGALPDPAWAASTARQAGCDSIVCHLREDRRHIQENDLWAIKKKVKSFLNLEMSTQPEIVRIACRVRPHQATFVPERREELTTEGGLDLKKNYKKVESASHHLRKAGIRVSLFLDPNKTQIHLAHQLNIPMIEIHTGHYANAATREERQRRLRHIEEAAHKARSLGLIVAAGHGLDYRNIEAIAAIPGMEELNIGFSIIAHSLEVGLYQAVREMTALVHRR